MTKRLLIVLLFFLPLIPFANPLPASDVFKLSTSLVDPNTFSINWTIKPGYFLYSKRIKLQNASQNDAHFGTMRLPVAQNKTDRLGHVESVYRNQLTIPVAILSDKPGEILLNIYFQGCSDEGFCYPPQTNQIKLAFGANLLLNSALIEPTDTSLLDHENTTPSAQVDRLNTSMRPSSENKQIDLLFSSNNWFLIILSFYGFGLLLAFTPCVLPMVPVLSGLIIGHGHTISTRKAFFLSLSYVLSMSITYGIIGAVIALMGSNLQIVMQSPIAITLFSIIFVLLALSMFNLYEFRLPLSWQNKLANTTRSQAGGHYLGAAIMGSMSILILSPCVTAPLFGALSYIAQSGDIILGLSSLFFLSLGMGTPLLLIGTSAGKLLPKAGPWMNVVKALFGVMLFAVAIYLMTRILPVGLIMGLWASLLIFSGIFLKPVLRPATNQGKFRLGVSIMLIVYGLLILIGASIGNSNPLIPLRMTHLETSSKNTPNTVVVKTVSEAKLALALAKQNNKAVMLDFYASWCASCKVIANTTLQNKQVLIALAQIIQIKADLSINDANSQALLAYFHVVAPPTFLFYDTEGNLLEQLRLVGDISTDTLLERISHVSK